jgi:site-specific DNA recombinase
MKPSRRESLLMAIAQARSWVDELANGRVGSLAALARREGKAERHIRLLLPLAFVSPRIVSTILGGTAPAGLTITALAHALPWSWAEQERHLGLPGDQPAHLPNHTRLLS